MNSVLDRAGVASSSKLEVTGAEGKPLYVEIMERLLEGRQYARGEETVKMAQEGRCRDVE